jgi:hypothetical protein
MEYSNTLDLTKSPVFSSFQRIPANVSKADATNEVAEAAQAYLAKLQAEREAA